MPKRIFIFGDSIAWGATDLKGGGWVDRFKIFFRDYAGRFNQVFNLAISGHSTKTLLNRIKFETKIRTSSSDRKYVVIIALSVNDACFRKSLNNFQIPIKEYEELLKNLVQEIDGIADDIVFIGQTNVQDTKTNPWLLADGDYFLKNKDIEKYNFVAKNFCEKNNLPFIETFDLLDDKDLDDGLHPNAKGHEKMFVRVRDFLIDNKII